MSIQNTSVFDQAVLFKKTLNDEERQRVSAAIQTLADHSARPYLVGGAVRDHFLHIATKDIDIEVHGISLDELAKVLKQFGYLNMVGKSFGVLKWEHSNIDWSVPRRDKAGRKPEVQLDPNMNITEALRRRDLTVNAMAIDLLIGDLVDPFGGKHDLEHRIARSPDARFFTEDPLRFYRVMQFIGRFGLSPDDELNRVCAEMNIDDVSRERISTEFEKLFLKSRQPSLGIRWIYSLHRLPEVLPELALTVGVLQEPEWHPEGDVFEHSMEALDAAATIHFEDDNQKLTLLSAALCHDLGKSVSSYIDRGRIRSTGHEVTGVPLARKLMQRITGNKKRIVTVCKLVEHHMAPGSFIKNNARDGAYRRLALKLAPETNLNELCMLFEADRRGRNPERLVPLPGTLPIVEQFRERAKKLGILYGPEAPVLMGKDLQDYFPAGKQMGKALEYAFEIQTNEGIRDKAKLLKRVIAYFGK